ncbi:MAG: hypothetical protein QG660_956, partial [Pseudomonadota bacterium]|nr:hypothetical protein [Pseudomonadota bacterium]
PEVFAMPGKAHGFGPLRHRTGAWMQIVTFATFESGTGGTA